MFVWYHDDAARTAAVSYTATMYPDPNDRPAVHYLHSTLPYWAEVQGQFLIQYDMMGVRNAKRRVINVPGVRIMDGDGRALPAGVVTGNLCSTSVCLGNDARTGAMGGSLEEQTRLAFRNARSVIEAAGFSSADLGHLYVWYTDQAARDTVDKVWAEVFPRPEDRPPRHSLVTDLPPGALGGVEATAAR